MNPVRILNYGGGVNSTALIVEAYKRQIPIDAIFFSFTGSEPPEIHWEENGKVSGFVVDHMDPWCRSHGLPPIVIVRWIRQRNDHRTLPIFGDMRGKFLPLHEWCEKLNQVPSKAFGRNFDGCSSKWKRQVVDGSVEGLTAVQDAWSRGEKVERWIGYDADEPQRQLKNERQNIIDSKFHWRAPLVEWKMGRNECVLSIAAAGLPIPRKSACWMCPSSKPHELDRLKKDHPELLERALRMERNAIEAGNLGQGGDVRGLGGRFNWNDYMAGKAQAPQIIDEIPCDCFDESDDEDGL